MSFARSIPVFVLAISLFWHAARAQAAPYEISTLLGAPNQEMPFVGEVVKNRVSLVPGENYADLTTGVLYFAWKNGARSVETIQVVREGGNVTLADIFTAIDQASRDSAVVIAPLVGTGFEEMCARMAGHPETAFLVTLGEPGYTLSPFYTKCASRNILFVTTLNPQLTDLGEFSSYGPLVRLATPGTDLAAPVDATGRTASFLSDAFGMAVAAGQITQTLRKEPSLRGADLIARFLGEAETLPSLRGKVPGARALLRFER